MTLERGTLLHKRYRIVEILGQGGMGSVYRAVDENLGVEVAVKDNLFTTEEYARQFRLEAVILASLRHANLPRVTDHFVLGEQGQYLVMDYIEGEDLRQRMERQGTIADEEAILIGVAMCDALHYLHTRKPAIVHRDVKPGNVKISPDGHIYLVDFGLAKVVRGSQATTTGARAMTPGYSPPEQYGTARTDPRSDVYSLGATLYASLCGVIPEDGLARAMDNIELTPLRKRSPKIGRKLAQAIEKAMSVRPDDRFRSAEDFKQALLTASVRTQQKDGEIVVTPPPPQPQAMEKEVSSFASEEALLEKTLPPSEPTGRKKRGSLLRMLFSILLLALVAGLTLYWKPITQLAIGMARTPTVVGSENGLATQPSFTPGTTAPTLRSTNTLVPTTTPVVRSTATTTPSKTPAPSAITTSTPVETLLPALTPQGGGRGQIAFASSRTGMPQIFLMDADGSRLLQLTNLPDGACQPDWSPAGDQIVFISPCPNRLERYELAQLHIMKADGSDIMPVSASLAGDFDPAWSPDGTRIAFASLRDGKPQIYIVNLADDGLIHVEMDNSIQEAYQPAWSPTGTQLAYTVRRVGLLQIWVMSDMGAGQAQLTRSGSEYYDFMPLWSADGKSIIFTQSQGPLTIGWLMNIPYEFRESQEAARYTNGTYAIDADYSPDGQWLVFETLNSGNYDLALMGLDGSGRIRLTMDPALDFDPAWRP